MNKIITGLRDKFNNTNISNYRVVILGVISIFLVLMLLVGSTYSLFKASNKDENLNVYKTGVLDVTYTLSEDNVVLSDVTPTAVEDINTIVPYRLTVNNVGTVDYKFDLTLVDTTATNAINYQYIMVQVGSLDAVALSSITDGVLKEGIVVPAGDSVDIDVRVWLSSSLTNSEIGKSFYAKLSIDGLAVHTGNNDIDNSNLSLPVEVFEYTGSVQSYTIPTSGYYKLEAWGAQGGSYSTTLYGGKGAYTSGEIYLEKGTSLYIYVGGVGGNNTATTNVGGYNGGGYSGNNGEWTSYGGGGATDFRLVDGAWNDFDSLKSRIMVAAGGGGSVYHGSYSGGFGGYGGSLIGGDGKGTYGDSAAPTGATQTAGGTSETVNGTNKSGLFAYAVQSHADGGGGGGGGGYYGGGMGNGFGGSGGSSFVSGHNGCNAISQSSTSSSISHIGTSNHYSGYVFKNSSMISGDDSMPTHNSSTMQVGNEGNGYAKITYVRDRSVMETNLGYTGNYQTYEVLQSGYYQIEAWGAQGGASLLDGGTYTTSNSTCVNTVVGTLSGYCEGGNGAYTSGEIYLEKGTTLYAYVGGKGSDAKVNTLVSGGYNGGGAGDYDHSDDEADGGGGGATDVRLINGSWNSFPSLKSRLMVAGGGGGASDVYSGLPGGDLSTTKTNIRGYSRTTALTLSTQVAGYRFGVGQDGALVTSNYPVAGGGGGYYGGFAPDGSAYDNISSGGSSYISGHQGAVAAGYKQKFTFEYFDNKAKAYDTDGNVILEGTGSAVPNVERTLNYLGKSNWSNNEYFSGQMYSFKITLADGSVLMSYDFTKKSVTDLSGNGYNGELMGGLSFCSDGSDYALCFDGVDDYLQLPTLPSSINWAGGFKVEVELIFHQLNYYSRIMDFGGGQGINNIIIQVYNTTNQLDFMVDNTNNTNWLLSTSTNEGVINLNGMKYSKDGEKCETGDTDISCSYHYSGYIFSDSSMINGNSSQPTHDGSSTQNGNKGNGFLKIKYLGK